MFKKLGIIITLVMLTLGICACANDNGNSNQIALQNVKRVDDIEFDDTLSYEKINIDNPDYLSNTFMDVEPDFQVKVLIESFYLSDSDIESSIIGTECGGDDISLSYKFSNDLDQRVVLVSAKDGFLPGNAYTIDISNDNNLTFYAKNPNIRNIIFTVKDQDHEELETITYPDYDFNKVSHFLGYGDYDTYLYFDGTINEDTSDIITFSNNSEKIYIEILRKTTENGLTKIYYKCPDADKIFNKCDMHIDNKELNMEDDFVLSDVEEMALNMIYSDFVLVHLYAITDSYGFSPAIDKLIDIASVGVNFKPEGNKITLGFNITFTFEFDSGWRLCASFKFQWVKTFNASADAELETFLGIPTGIKMNCAVSSDESFTFQFLVSLKNPKFNVGYVPDTPKDLDLSRATRAVNELKEKWVEADSLGYKRDKVVGDTMMINIGYIFFHFGYVSLDIDLYVCMKLDLNITLGIAYTYSRHDVIVNYSSSSGNGDGGASPSKVEASVVSGSLAGTLSNELFLKIRFSLYITGLKYLASISVDLDAGVYLTISGLGSISYNFITEEFNSDAAAQIEFGFFFRVKLSVSLLYIFNPSWDLYNVKAPLLKLGWQYNIKERSSSDTLELNKIETNIKDTNLLVFNVFDADGLAVMTKTFSYDTEVNFLESVFISKPLSYSLFKSITTDNDKVRIANGKIFVDNDVAETSGNIIIEINTSSFSSRKITVPFHYKSSDAKYVTIDGNNRTPYLPGQTVTVNSDVLYKDGYIFRGWYYNGKIYHVNDTFIMPDRDVNLVAYYTLEVYYTVRFFDGNGNLISEQLVLNTDGAIAPEYEQYKMDDYHFVCWDKDFSSITGDTDVYGIYEREGEII